ncbi:hypothetical protein [Pseudogemmobacter hezensis]|nr:hypothetical protein [Pseudogemmobacter hezensis]
MSGLLFRRDQVAGVLGFHSDGSGFRLYRLSGSAAEEFGADLI